MALASSLQGLEEEEAGGLVDELLVMTSGSAPIAEELSRVLAFFLRRFVFLEDKFSTIMAAEWYCAGQGFLHAERVEAASTMGNNISLKNGRHFTRCSKKGRCCRHVCCNT